MEKILNEIDTKKAVGTIDTTPRKLIKKASNFLVPILTTAINTSIENSVFPDDAKFVTVVPLDREARQK